MNWPNKNYFFICLGILFAVLFAVLFAQKTSAIEGLFCEKTAIDTNNPGTVKFTLTLPCNDISKVTNFDCNPDGTGVGRDAYKACITNKYNEFKNLIYNTCLGGSLKYERFAPVVKQRACWKQCGVFIFCTTECENRLIGVPTEGDLPEINKIPTCPSLIRAINLSVSSTKVDEGGSYKADWSAQYPPADRCSFSVSGSLAYGKVYTTTSNENSVILKNLERGIYTNTLICNGFLNAQETSIKGSEKIVKTVYVGEIPDKPTVILKVEPASIKKGESATLTWLSENAVSVSLNQGLGVVRTSGSTRVSPDFTTRYTISASGEFLAQGVANSSVTLKVVAPEIKRGEAPEEVPEEKPVEIKPPVEKLKVDLRINGQKGPLTMSVPAIFNISWNLDKYCLTYGSWLGIKTKAGEERQTQTKPGTYTYNMYCPTIGTDSVEVKVVGGVSGGQAGQATVPLPVAEASISADNISFSNKIRVIRGEPTDIWLSAGYDVTGDWRASRDDTGKWAAMSNGGQCQFNYDLNQGAPSFEAAIDDPETAKTCTIPLGKLTFYDQPGVYRYGILRLIQGDNKVSNVSYVTIVVQEPPPPETPPIIDFRINNLEGPSLALGAPAEYTVSWNVANADTCQASDSWEGNKFMAGSEKFVSSEKKEFVYTLSCTGKLGTTVKSINLKVAELPVCDFSAEPTVLNKKSVFEQQSVLAWKCKFANTCSISPDIGTKVETFGSARVSPKITTNYNLSCANLEGNASFIQTVEVK